LKINNCLYSYGKYLDSFKPNFTYSVSRISLREKDEIIDITAKDELEEDDKRKHNELSNLGLLYKLITNPVTNDKNKDKDKFPSFINEINSIDDKVKQECIKIYTGEFAKIINNPEKMPNSLVVFIQNVKSDMENFRLKSIRDLRTYVIYIIICKFFLESKFI
jgi:hypothetical protein